MVAESSVFLVLIPGSGLHIALPAFVLLLYLPDDVLIIVVSVVFLLCVAVDILAGYMDVSGFCQCFCEPGP